MSSDLAERIDKVDSFYAAQLKRVDDFYGQRVDYLIERCERLEAVVADLSVRLHALEQPRA